MSKYNLAGKTILITGAAGGIGSAAARKFAREGARLVLVDLSADAVNQLAEQLPAGSALPYVADVTDLTEMTAAVDAAVATFGRLDVVWANAGIANNPPVTLATADLESYEKVIEVDTFGVVRTIKPALAQITANKGQVVITGSGYSFVNAVVNSAYGISKCGVEMLGRCLRAELAPYGATATVLYPGWTQTPITESTQQDPVINELFKHGNPGPLGKMFPPETVADALARGLKKRSPRIFTPRPWAIWSTMRGIINPAVDLLLTKDRTILRLLREIETKRRSDTPALSQP